jgi:hypothetical protein
MSRAMVIAVAFVAVVVGASAVAADEDGVRILLVDASDVTPSGGSVQRLLEEQLASYRVRVELVEHEAVPETAAGWTGLARSAGREPGTLGVVGWRCGKRRCRLFVVETRSEALVELAVPRGQDDERAALALAGVIREVVLGTLIPELFRLAEEAREPTQPPDADGEAQAGVGDGAAGRPWLWLEVGYHGEYPYPGDRALHGPWVGLSAEASEHLAPRLTVGWLGIQRSSEDPGEVITHRLPIALGLQLAFAAGRATFSMMPAVRLDLVFSETDPVNPAVDGSESVDPELHVGGVFGWRLPLPASFMAVIGAGLYGTVLGRRYQIDSTTVMPRSKLRIVWIAGIAWSPL